MTILNVIGSVNPTIGGPCQGIRNSIGDFAKLGVVNEVVCLDDPAEDFISGDSFPIYALGPTKNAWSYNARLLPWLIKNLLRFDVVIMHGLWLYPSHAVRQAMHQLTRMADQSTVTIPRFFVMPHGMLDPYFQRTAQRRFKALRNWIYWKFIENHVVNSADGLLFTCETERILAQQTFQPYQPRDEITIGYGVVTPPAPSADLLAAFSVKCPQIADKSYVLFLSRIHDKKGVDLLVQAYADLVNAQPEREAAIPRLVIAGPGMDTPYGESVRQLVARYPAIKERIHFPGMLTGAAKWGALYGCQAFILPSHQENFGIAVAEALACGKPVLISNQVNIWREIQEGGGGLVEPDTLEGTRRLLERWLSLPAEAQQQIGRAAQQTFELTFRMDQAVRRLNDALITLH